MKSAERRWIAAILLAGAVSIVEAAPDSVKQGEYIFRAAGCVTCHTDDKNKSSLLAGGRALKTVFGVFYTPNITPDPQYGIGRWSDEDFIRALRLGVSPRGEQYYPAFPYTSYTRLTDDDLRALKAYLFSVKPVAQPNKSHDLVWYVRFRPALAVWKKLFFTPGAYQVRTDKPASWNRGAYLAAVAHCAECHTPRGVLGNLQQAKLYSGTRDGPENAVVPNITPDKKTGIGRWSRSDLTYYLATGATPDGDYAGDLMADVIDNGLRYLRKDDVQAIAEYIQSLPAFENPLTKQKNNKKKSEFDY
ncbi:MAG: cytochrome c [Gammaproteobacteria bacterium]|nr:cytochrome c [Gammaproteobacteria bacterium]